MTCARVRTCLQCYVDGRLSVRRLARVEAHLESCAACRQDLSVLEAVCLGASNLSYVEEPEALTRAIMARVSELEARRTAGARRFSLGLADALLASALATVVTVIFLWFQPGLREMASASLAHALLPIQRTYLDLVDHWGSWVAWLVWTGVGLVLAIWFAGGEVRATWRRTLAQRLPRS